SGQRQPRAPAAFGGPGGDSIASGASAGQRGEGGGRAGAARGAILVNLQPTLRPGPARADAGILTRWAPARGSGEGPRPGNGTVTKETGRDSGRVGGPHPRPGRAGCEAG